MIRFRIQALKKACIKSGARHTAIKSNARPMMTMLSAGASWDIGFREEEVAKISDQLFPIQFELVTERF